MWYTLLCFSLRVLLCAGIQLTWCLLVLVQAEHGSDRGNTTLFKRDVLDFGRIVVHGILVGPTRILL